MRHGRAPRIGGGGGGDTIGVMDRPGDVGRREAMGGRGGAEASAPLGCDLCRDREPPPPRCPACGLARADRPDWQARATKAAGWGAAWRHPDDDVRLEYRLRVIAPPAVFALAFLLMQSDGWRSFLRVFVTMWMHELGHASAAWLSGFAAFPGPWRTAVADERSLLLSLLLLAGLVALGVRAYLARRFDLLGVVAAVTAALLACTLLLEVRSAQALITFGGDAGMMVLGAALAFTFWARPGSHLHTSWLRWGFLVIGALALADAMTTWWAARTDVTAIPYGLIEGVGESDPVVLEDRHGWTQRELISRHVRVGSIALAAVAARYAAGLLRPPPAPPRPEVGTF
jgi:hypothetical protein